MKRPIPASPRFAPNPSRPRPLLALTALAAASAALIGCAPHERGTVATLAPRVQSVDGAVALHNPADGRRRGIARRDDPSIRERLREGEEGTYIAEILESRDSNVARWPNREGRPLRVWVQPATHLDGWDPAYVGIVQGAFTEWAAVGIPVPFRFTTDSVRSDIHVTWRERFNEPISGKTRWARDDGWWIIEGNITLALHHHQGDPLGASAVRAIALHEVGHLLGLDHTADISNIMTPRVRVRELSDADRATLRLIYSLPAGAVR